MDLYDVIMSLPLFWKICVVFIVVFGNILYLFRKQMMKLIKKFRNNKNIIRDHSLFSEKSFIKHKINLINVGDDKKNKIFRKLLLIKYESILKYSYELIDMKDLDNLSNAQFYAIIIKNMTLIVEDYNSKILADFGRDIFDLVMEHPEKGFNNIHEKVIVFIKGNIESSLKSDHVIFKTPFDKIDFLFDMYYIAMKIAMTDVDKIYKNFNGDLDKLIKKKK